MDNHWSNNYLDGVNIENESFHLDKSTCTMIEDRSRYHHVDLFRMIESVYVGKRGTYKDSMRIHWYLVEEEQWLILFKSLSMTYSFHKNDRYNPIDRGIDNYEP